MRLGAMVKGQKVTDFISELFGLFFILYMIFKHIDAAMKEIK